MNYKKYTKPKLFKITAVILISISFFTWQTEPVQAIICGPINAEQLQSGLDEFEAVFIGEVISVDYPNPDTVQNGTAHYRVDRVFKGSVSEQFSMKASGWGDPFAGFTYLMFIDSLEDPAFDSPAFAADCRNTTVAQIEFDYMAILGDGYSPTAGSNRPDISFPEKNPEESSTNASTLPIVGVILATGVIGALFTTRFFGRKKSSPARDSGGAIDLIEVSLEKADVDIQK